MTVVPPKHVLHGAGAVYVASILIRLTTIQNVMVTQGPRDL